MPKSKRQKLLHTSKVVKKDKDQKAALFSSIRTAIDTYEHCYIFSVRNMRNTFLKYVRAHFAPSTASPSSSPSEQTDSVTKGGRIFFGKTKVMAKSLGQTVEESYSPGLSDLASHVNGNVGLLLTSQPPPDVLEYLTSFSEQDFARAGVKATREIVIPGGTVMSRGGEIAAEDDVAMPHSLEVTLRKWGMPTRLDKGKVLMDQEWRLCRKGEKLNSHQTALLKLFGITMVEFKIKVRAYWEKESGTVTEVEGGEDDDEEEEEEEGGVEVDDMEE